MVRIRVTPENLQSLSEFIARKNGTLQSADTQFQSILNSLDWETRQKINIDAEINKARTQARTLAAQADELVRTLKVRAQAFEQADRQSVDQLGKLDDSIKQFVRDMASGLKTVGDWLKKYWPFLPIAILPIITIPLLPKIPWPPKIIPKPTPTPTPTPPIYIPKTGPILISPNPRYRENGWKYMQRWPFYKGMKGNGIHTGIDIPPSFDTDNSITPIGPGEVYEVGNSPSYGYYIVIKHKLADGSVVFSKYTHLQNLPDLKVKDPVNIDTKIGFMGKTGSASNNVVHLHLEITNKYPPVSYMNGKNPDLLYSPNGPSNLERMKEDYINPIDVLNGNLGWEFQSPP